MQTGDLIADRFELEKLAGSGAMGEVWRARDRETGDLVAVKLLGKTEDGWSARFVREALSIAQLDHPAIVRYVAHGPLPDSFFVAMEWLDGEDLAQRLRRGPLSVEGTIGLVRRVAEGLVVAHAHGIVHRDIKPGNLFLPRGSLQAVKVVDFGVAKIKDLTGTWTRNGSVLGTPAYMAPEQIRGEITADARVDLFALGCVAFECVTGRVAFGGGQVLAALRSILNDEAPRLSEALPNVPPEFDVLVRRMMAKAAYDRPRDAAEIVRALSGFEVPPDIPGDARPPRAITAEEQRIVTVLFIEGAAGAGPDAPTLLSKVPHPDELDASHALASLIERTSAKIERFAGDSFALTFPAQGVPTDRATQAARCAIHLAEVMPGRSMALATGPRESVPSGALGEGVAGVAILRARGLLPPSRTAADGPVGAPVIAIDETTARLLDARFEVVRGDRCLELRSEALPDTLGARVGALARESGATLLGRPKRCIGRDRELGAIRATLAQCADESVARVVLVTAPPGAGKSQLRRELTDSLGREPGAFADLTIRFARADPMKTGAPFGLVGQLGRTTQAFTTAPPIVADEAAARAFEEWVKVAVSRGPVLLVIEDLQWGDAPSVKILDSLLRDLRDAPLMVLALARPEVHELFPRLWADREPQEIRLGTLTRSAGERLIAEALGGNAEETAVARIVEQADGNPFYIEELIRSEAEHRETASEPLIAMVQARLSSLDPEARRLLRAASIFGPAFWKGGLLLLLGSNTAIDATLVDLLAAKIIVAAPVSRFVGEDEFHFTDALLCEGAYAMLTEADRALGHDLAREWFIGKGEENEALSTGHRSRSGHLRSA